MTSDYNFQKAREAWGDKVVAPTHRVFQEWLNNPLTKALKQSHKNEIEKLAQWMIKKGYATGHGDTIEDLLQELDWQIAENWNRALIAGITTEREACAKLVEILIPEQTEDGLIGHTIAKAIRERGEQ